MNGGVRYLLDTNIVSETRKTRPEKRVMSLLMAADEAKLFISVLTLGELRKGVAMKRGSDPDGAKRIGAWVDGIEDNFADRILPVDAVVAHRWGEISADRVRPVIDMLIAATAIVHDLMLVTRNTDDLRGLAALATINPWTATV